MSPPPSGILLHAGLHLASAGLLANALGRAGASRRLALFVGILFAVHPVQIASIVGDTRWLLGTTVWMVGLNLQMLRGRSRGEWILDLAAIGCVLGGMFLTPSTLLLPAASLVLEAAGPGPGRSWRRILTEDRPLFVAALLGAVIVYLRLEGPSGWAGTFTLTERIEAAARAVHETLRDLLIPTSLAGMHVLRLGSSPLGSLLPAAGWTLAGLLVAHQLPRTRPGLAWLAVLSIPPAIEATRAPVEMPSATSALALAGLAWAIGAPLLANSAIWRSWVAAALVLAALGMSVREARFWTDGPTLLARIVEVQPRHWRAWTRLGDLRLSTGDVPSALECYSIALSHQPAFAWAQTGLADALRAEGQLESARLLYENVLETGWSDPRAAPRLGFALLRGGLNHPAAVILERSLRTQPEDGDAHAGLALALARAGQTDRARAHLDRALAIGTTSLEARLCAAWLMATAPEAELLDPAGALALAQGDEDPRMLDAAAAALAHLGRFAEALSVAQDAAAALEREGWPLTAADVRARGLVYLQRETWTEPRGSAPGAHQQVQRRGRQQDRR
jgi:tetratricopeptide (TPR) repeat protein